jgi:hypothetical protein
MSEEMTLSEAASIVLTMAEERHEELTRDDEGNGIDRLTAMSDLSRYLTSCGLNVERQGETLHAVRGGDVT